MFGVTLVVVAPCLYSSTYKKSGSLSYHWGIFLVVMCWCCSTHQNWAHWVTHVFGWDLLGGGVVFQRGVYCHPQTFLNVCCCQKSSNVSYGFCNCQNKEKYAKLNHRIQLELLCRLDLCSCICKSLCWAVTGDIPNPSSPVHAQLVLWKVEQLGGDIGQDSGSPCVFGCINGATL